MPDIAGTVRNERRRTSPVDEMHVGWDYRLGYPTGHFISQSVNGERYSSNERPNLNSGSNTELSDVHHEEQHEVNSISSREFRHATERFARGLYYTIANSFNEDITEGRISNNSPVDGVIEREQVVSREANREQFEEMVKCLR